MKLKFSTLLILIILLTTKITFGQEETNNDNVTVLNFATFHLSNTTDANSSPVDINNPSVKKDIDEIVQKLVKFKPTIICVEVPSKFSDGTNDIYQEYKKDQSRRTNWPEEINSIAFEVGRLAEVEKIYGIDHKLEFDYMKLIQLAKDSNSEYDREFIRQRTLDLEKFNQLSVLEKYHTLNSEKWRSDELNFYNFLSTINTQDKLEGVEIIADFYKRNLAIYSNLSNIPFDKIDRILIILGGAHSAYLDLFLENNPDIRLVDPKKYVVQ